MRQIRILLLDSDPVAGLVCVLETALQSLGFLFLKKNLDDSMQFFCEGSLLASMAGFKPDLICIALSPGGVEKADRILQAARRAWQDVPILVVSETCEPDDMFALLKQGAADFITSPLNANNVLPRIWRLVEQARQEDSLLRSIKEKLGLRNLIGESSAFLTEINRIPLMAKCDVAVLISGETGTGKDLCARAIHYLSPRANKPFVPVNCGAIPVDLIENELFGHERGAFTGASSASYGLIREADGGTLFLDEVDCLPLLAQVKLLRFLQEKEYRPLGSTKTLKADLRIITATNSDFEETLKAGKLRQDLYYRLNVIPLALPPLRERREDIPLLASHFLAKYAAEFNKPAIELSAQAMQKLLLYDWPGNVRELEHVIERAVVLCQQKLIRDSDITVQRVESKPQPQSFQEAKAEVVARFEKTYIQTLLVTYQGNITKAARASSKNRRAFWQLIRKYQIDVHSFKTRAS